MKTYKFEIFADYFQFFIQDEKAEGINGDSWPKDASDRMLAVEAGTVGVGTVRNMNVDVVVEIHKSEPALDNENWDQINECSINLQSRKLVIAGCTDYFPDAARIKIRKGRYRVRVAYGKLDNLSEDGLDGDDNYRLQLWPSDKIGVEILQAR